MGYPVWNADTGGVRCEGAEEQGKCELYTQFYCGPKNTLKHKKYISEKTLFPTTMSEKQCCQVSLRARNWASNLGVKF
jgi:hypothetical protein